MQARELHALTHDAIIALYTIDLTAAGVTVNPIRRFCEASQTNGTDVSLGGVTYAALPIKCTGFETSGKGQLPTPQLTVSNIFSIFTPLLLQYQDLLGSKVTRIRTFAKHLDGGSNPNPSAISNPDIYYVERKVSESCLEVTFELQSNLDLNGVQIPNRICYSGYCSWDYRSSECGYTGTNYFNEFNVAVSNPAFDKCPLTLTACELRKNSINFGGFPGLGNTKFQ